MRTMASDVLGERYKIGEVIAQGSMATVYRGEDLRTRRAVAIKVLREVYSTDPLLVTRFRGEMQAASSVQHPNIVQIYDYGQSDSNYFIVMELVDGTDLRRYLRSRGVLDMDRAIIIAHDVALGLGAAHRRGIVHRDVKPPDILIGRDGSIKLTDFGSASLSANTNVKRLTTPDMVVGQVQYAAPEQVMGQNVNPAADIYSLGIVMYEMLTGRPPFDGDTPVAVAMQHVHNNPTPPSRLNSNIPPAVEAVIMRCLEKDLQKRYRDGSALARALEMLGEPEENEDRPGVATPELAREPTMRLQNVPPPVSISSNAQSMDLLLSSQLPANTILRGRYHIIEQVGKGGMGAVYKARDTAFTTRLVAVKQMFQSGLAPQMLTVYTDNFKREANLLAGLIHPNLPHIYDYFSEGECWYLVMDYIEGINLQRHIEQAGGRLSVEETLRIGIDLCAVLGYLHSQQQPIVFRDLKPANVMMTQRGNLYLIDFGIARQYKPEQTRDTHHFLTAGYAAPEQYGHSHTQTTPQSDIYSLGATLHQMLSGNNPSDTPFDFAPLRVGIPELATLIQQMLEIRPANRPTSIEVVQQTLQRILAQVQNGEKPAPAPRRRQSFKFSAPQPASPEQKTPVNAPERGSIFGYLHMIEGNEPGRVYELSKNELAIGRSRESDIFLEDLAVARLHAKLFNIGNSNLGVADQGSANGTKVNGQSLTRYQAYPLQEGDKIQMGQTIFVFSRNNKIAAQPEQPKGPAPNSIAILRIENGKEAGRPYELHKDTFTIGRSRESDMFLEDLAVSRLHASVISQGNGIYAIKDEGSANGTKLNGQSVNRYQAYPLQVGDRIQVGATVLIFSYR